jgi:hypothetical protein
MNILKYLSCGYRSFLFFLILFLGIVDTPRVIWAESPKETPTAVSASPCPSPKVEIVGWKEYSSLLPEGTLTIRLWEGWHNFVRLPRFYPRGEEGAKAIEADFWKRGNDYFFQWIQDEEILPLKESRLPEEVEPSQYAQCEETLGGRKVGIESRLLAAKDPDKSQIHIFYQAAATIPVPGGQWLVISGTLKSRQAQEQLLRSFRTIRIKN